MATSRTIYIAPENTGLWNILQSKEAAEKTTELLQEDLEKHHCFINDKGFHNHISHHLLSLYGIGARASHIQKAYDDNTDYQRGLPAAQAKEVEEITDFEMAKEKLGDESHYPNFLAFFQNEIDRMGWREVLMEYLFKGDERSDDMLVRMFEGLLHPIIQLLFGIEWEQPALIAMGLAQAAVHKSTLHPFLTTAENPSKTHMPSISTLYDVVAALKLPLIRTPDDTLFNGMLNYEELLRVVAKVHVEPEQLEEKTIEMWDACVGFAAGAAVRTGKEARFDFFMMHHITVNPLFLTINAQPWIPTATKTRLLEWKIRFDLLGYAARSCPPAGLDKIKAYVPKDGEGNICLADLLPRIYTLPDLGHVSKLIRAFHICEVAGEKYTNQPWMMIKNAKTWIKLHQMAVEGGEGAGPTFVYDAAREEAWVDVPDRA